MEKCCVLILAAGKGTRMHSAKPKVLQELLGEPMLGLLVHNLAPLFGEAIYAVCGHGREKIAKAFPNLKTIVQAEQLGTGHAVQLALPTLREAGYSRVLILNGDTPLVTADVVSSFLAQAKDADLAVATVQLKDPGAYGRIVREAGAIKAIVEAKDYSVAQYGEPSGEINAGVYVCSIDVAHTLLPQVTPSIKSGEYYFTDIVALALKAGKKVVGINCGRDERLLGINSPKELVHLEECLRAEIVERFLNQGVLLHAKELIRISPLAQIAPGAEITGPCEIYGASVVESGAKIMSHCVLQDSLVHAGAEIRSFSHLQGAEVGEGCLVGPFARLRPGAVLEQDAHVGNFVELKKTHLGAGSKANHLTYLGDAVIGERTNIGAGTITCNYDGKYKHPTIIGSEAFIGSNTALVAPVKVGEGALIGAGSTITRDVPAEQLAVARARQKNYDHKPLPKETTQETQNS
ncbi:MAG: bifunctional UDP-N-acetylglucosamine diphosphorylase/glucosamine-1-phosphate N-acetyltransferase GlmU [Desulfovibrionaceae bacterium]|nr:bifunctional UDP-N-acetylglucosamine diphosphorylase/glucosamine-1-phosphate N-acetyltransferase GlmU [Desulfovibrionaceae bacterium]